MFALVARSCSVILRAAPALLISALDVSRVTFYRTMFVCNSNVAYVMQAAQTSLAALVIYATEQAGVAPVAICA